MQGHTLAARVRSMFVAAAFTFSLPFLHGQQVPPLSVNPATMPKIATIDPRFASYNVEMVEVTGGRFWKPFNASHSAPEASNAAAHPNPNQQVGDNASMFEYRPPIDLSNARLRKLAAALGPAYIRVSGSWANSTYFQNDDGAPLKEPPAGFRGVLTRAEWKGVVDFAREVNARIVTSVAVSPGVRDAKGKWLPDQAKALFDYTKSVGGSIAATEFMNEPTIPGPGGAPANYDAAAFANDIMAFAPFVRKESPGTVFLGPGSAAEGTPMMPGGGAPMRFKLLPTSELMAAAPPVFDAFSYHFYGTVSHRCMGNLKVEEALSADWLDRTNASEAYYAAFRDKYLPGKPMWLTETAEAACGGDPLAHQFVDTFRFLNQFGALAQRGVQTVMHNTLASSDYGLLDENSYEPRPDYWAALLWKRMMGPVVLDPRTPKGQGVRVYAQCSLEHPGGVAVLALNTDTHQAATLSMPVAGEQYTLTSPDLSSTSVLLNGAELKAAPDGSLPAIHGRQFSAGVVQLPPASVTFLDLPRTANQTCGR